MSFSDRRRDGGEGRGVEGKYSPSAVIGADFEARCRSSRQPELKSSSGTHPFKNLKHDLSCFPVTKLTLSKHWIFLHNVKTKLSVNIGLQHCHITYVNKSARENIPSARLPQKPNANSCRQQKKLELIAPVLLELSWKCYTYTRTYIRNWLILYPSPRLLKAGIITIKFHLNICISGITNYQVLLTIHTINGFLRDLPHVQVEVVGAG